MNKLSRAPINLCCSRLLRKYYHARGTFHNFLPYAYYFIVPQWASGTGGQPSYCTDHSRFRLVTQLFSVGDLISIRIKKRQSDQKFMLTIVDSISVGRLKKMTQNLPLLSNSSSCEMQGVEGLNCGVKVSSPGQSDRLIALNHMATGELVFEKHANSKISLQQVLSDTISGSLMEDAMVMPCGHSFGISGLLCVKETNLCLTCGAPVPADSMIPNYALRAAVLAYKCEGTRWKRESGVQAESDGRRSNRAFQYPEVLRPKGVQLPYVANDRVLIKGNKRTPERFVGREAIITTQCLNGWYLVKTLDTGESVRLQYRSLSKFRDKDTTTESSREKLTDENWNGDVLERPFISACHSSLSAYNDEHFHIDKIDTNSFLCGAAKGPSLESLDRAEENCRSKRGNQGRVTDTSGASWHIGHTCGSSSQELQGGQICGKRAQEAATMYDSVDEDQRAIKRSAAIGAMGGVIEGSTLQSNCSLHEHNATQCKVWEAENGRAEMKTFKEAEAGLAGEFIPAYSFLGSKCQGKHPRPKHISSQFHKGLSSGSNLREADPYKKVYMSGRRRGTNNANSRWLMTRKQSAFASVNLDLDHCSASLAEERQEANAKTSGESSNYQNAVSFCETLRRRMLDLETEIPWSCMHSNWKEDQAVWLDMLQKSSTLKDVAKRLEEFRRALILEDAGNMSDNEWNKELEAAVEQEAMEAVDTLWRRLHDDISKLLVSKFKRDRKPLNSIKVEFLKLKNYFPQLCIGGLSHVGVIAATSMAAAEAYAGGEQDIETLLTIPIKLVQENNMQDLRAVIDAIEREKRHLSSKVLDLCSGGRNCGGKPKAEDLLIENPNRVPVSLKFLAVESEELLKSELAKESTMRTKDARCIVYDKEPVLVDADAQDKEIVPGGEETDVSDSD